MSVLGIDIGTSYAVLASVAKGNVTVLRNDLSERLTPCLVGFKENERLLGDQALSQLKSNYQNTCRQLKQLMGRVLSEPDMQIEERYSLCPLRESNEAGLVGCEVSYQGKRQIFSATRVMAMLFAKLRAIAESALALQKGPKVEEVVIGVPGWYTDINRQAVLDAAKIARFGTTHVMNEHTATALDYGIYRSKSFHPETPTRVMFVNMGHGSSSVTVADFRQNDLKICSVCIDRQLGGRDMDRLIVEYFAKKFQEKYTEDPLSNVKARLKMEDQAEKAKKILSANSDAPFAIECLLGDLDFSAILTRQDFEEMCADLKLKLHGLLTSAVEESGAGVAAINSVEIVGGCTRIPWVQSTITQFFDSRLELSKTLNLDECVARGCALRCAMLSRRFKVREFKVDDKVLVGVRVTRSAAGDQSAAGQPDGADGAHELALFKPYTSYPRFKTITFDATKPTISLAAELYSNTAKTLPPSVSTHLGVFTVDVPTNLDAQKTHHVKVETCISINSQFGIRSSQLISEETFAPEANVPTPPPAPAASAAPQGDVSMEGSGSSVPDDAEGNNAPQTPAAAESEPGVTSAAPTKVSRPVRVTQELTVRIRRPQGWFTNEDVLRFTEEESKMASADLEVQMSRDCLNALESFIYNTQDQLSSSGSLRKFATEEEIGKVLPELEAVQNWLFDNIDEAAEVYTSKLNSLKELAEPFMKRKKNHELREEAFYSLDLKMREIRDKLQTPDANREIPEFAELTTQYQRVEDWKNSQLKHIQKTPLHKEIQLEPTIIDDQTRGLDGLLQKVLTPPAPPGNSSNKGANRNRKSDSASTMTNNQNGPNHENNSSHDKNRKSDDVNMGKSNPAAAPCADTSTSTSSANEVGVGTENDQAAFAPASGHPES